MANIKYRKIVDITERHCILRPCLYDPGILGCPGCPRSRRISSRVYMVLVHRDVPGDRDVSITLFHSKKRGKVDNNLSIKRKLILFA